MWREKFQRVLNAGWNNFRRNSYVSIGTTGVMTLVLLVFLGLVAVNFLASTIVVSLEEKVDVSAYFKSDATEDEILKVQSDLRGLAVVKSVEYVSQDEALADFKERHAGDALIQESLAELDDNPLQASLNIKARQAGQYGAIVEFLEGNALRTFIDKINYYENEKVISRIHSISGAIQNWGFLATLVLAAIAVLVTFNTIRLTIYSQKQEIEIMRLVGGSNWHIRAPYLVEGALYGSFAALIALVVFYPLVFVAAPKMETLMPGLAMGSYFIGHLPAFTLLIWGAGIVLGIVSSIVAIRKFLHI
ncbi:MAG: permease-like cell division protein FtsX [Patescibacteria group bacterium]